MTRHPLAELFGPPPATAVVAGSGLAGFAARIEDASDHPFSAIPGMPAPSVAGHDGRIIVGRAGPARFAALLGRSHRYEGHAPDALTAGVRALAEWGCLHLILTNSAGGLNPEFRPGDFMLIADHINRLNIRPAGTAPRQPFVATSYDAALAAAARRAARDEGLALREGVYAANMGPSFETPAEAAALRLMGADAVGMSTAHEAAEAARLGLRVLGLSCISNSLVAEPGAPTTHEEVLETSQRAADSLRRLLWRLLPELDHA